MALPDLNLTPPEEDAGDEMNQDAGDEIIMQEEENAGQNAGTKL